MMMNKITKKKITKKMKKKMQKKNKRTKMKIVKMTMMTKTQMKMNDIYTQFLIYSLGKFLFDFYPAQCLLKK